MIAAAWAFNLALDGLASVHDANSRYQQNAENDRAKSAVEISETCRDLGVNEFRQCIADRLESHYQEQATNKDLQAQQDMAYWAMLLLGVSVVGVLVSGGGVVLLVATIRQGKMGLGKATDAVIAAQETNAIMRQEQRPWLTLEVLDGCEMEIGKGSAKSRLTFRIKNHGKTPAFFTSTVTKVFPYDYPMQIKDLVDDLAMGSPSEDPSGMYEIIFPDEEIKIPPPDRQTFYFDGQGSQGYALVTFIIYRTTSDPKSPYGIEVRAYRIVSIGDDATSRHEVGLHEYACYRTSR